MRTQTAYGPQRPDGAQSVSLEHLVGEQTMTSPAPASATARGAGAHDSSGSRPQLPPAVQIWRQSCRPPASDTQAALSGHGLLSSQSALQTPSAPTSAHFPVVHARSLSASLASRHG